MKITEDYRNNIKALDSYLKTLCFSEESEKRIRAYVENPLSVLNDDIKRMFEKFDDDIVDFRIPLPGSMLKQRKKYQKEIYLILSTIFDCLTFDNQFKFDEEQNTNILLTPETIAENFFKVGNDKRKVWRYLDSKASTLAKKVYITWAENKTCMIDEQGEVREIIDIKDNRFKLFAFLSIMKQYLESLGTRKTSLREKIVKFTGSPCKYDITGMTPADAVNFITTNIIKPFFNIIQEIISAKMLDMDKFGLYLSFNVFDWILASTGEDWHSCIDMNGTYCYGVGLIGMCGCPDWGMLLYTNNQKKEACNLSSFHIVTRSWVCYTEERKFQIINWYPKNIQDSVSFSGNDDFKFVTGSSEKKSFSTWDPIVFDNGALAWGYRDKNAFYVTEDRSKVFFHFNGSGLPNYYKFENQVLRDREEICDSVIMATKKHGGSIWEAVRRGTPIKDLFRYPRVTYHCDCCSNTFDSRDRLIWVERDKKWVCPECFARLYFTCPDCGEVFSYEDPESLEVHYGPNPWDYDYMCSSCLTERMAHETVFYDSYYRTYYITKTSDNTMIKAPVIAANDNVEFIACYNVENAIAAGKIRRADNGVLHEVV